MPRCQAPGPDVPAEAWSLAVPAAEGVINPRDRKPAQQLERSLPSAALATPPNRTGHQAPGSRNLLAGAWCLVPKTPLRL